MSALHQDVDDSKSTAVLERLLRLHPKKIDLALDRIQRLLDDLGNPEKKLAPVIHVAGTNGKGSVCAFTRAMLEAQGLRVHVHIPIAGGELLCLLGRQRGLPGYRIAGRGAALGPRLDAALD